MKRMKHHKRHLLYLDLYTVLLLLDLWRKRIKNLLLGRERK